MTVGTATDETQPLLSNTNCNKGQHQITVTPLPNQDGAEIVDFDAHGDPDNPLEWPTPFKWTIVSMLALMAFTVTFTCISTVPLASTIVRDLSGDPNPPKSYSVLLVTIWELGEAAGPLIIAPLSELLGRYPVVNAANTLFVAATVLAATSATVPQFVVARMLTGLAVASNVLNPAVVGDIFVSEERGGPLSLIYLAPLVGGAAGPLMGSAIAQVWGWRVVVWIAVGLAAACEVMFLTCFRETYKVAILRARAARLERREGRRFKTEFDEEEGGVRESAWKQLWDAIKRPAIVLFGSGVLMTMSLFGSVVFTFFYIMSTTLADILVDLYRLSPVSVGSCYALFSLGSTISVVICNRTLDRIYVRMRYTHKGVGKPEFRLPLAIVGSFALPFTVAGYGWAAELRLPLVVLLFVTCFMGLSLTLAMIPLMAYIVDAFGLYSASALTGVIVMRCLMGTFLPLSTPPLIEMFGHGWGFMVLAGFSMLLAPISVLMLRYGAYWRRFCKYSRDA